MMACTRVDPQFRVKYHNTQSEVAAALFLGLTISLSGMGFGRHY
jgi:hypothetical protein